MQDAELNETIAALRLPGVQELGRYFARNLARADDLRWVHLHLIYPEIVQQRELAVMTQVMNERVVERVIGLDKRFTPEFTEEVRRRMMREVSTEDFVIELAHGAQERVDSLAAEDAQFGIWLRALEQSAIVALWSAFESLASDLWTFALNSRPDLFAVRVMKEFRESLQRQGLSSRSIPVGVAAKYGFDLRNHIGDIVGEVVNFAKMSEVKKAYTSAFGLVEEGQKLLQSEELKKLGLIRNLIVHRSGVVDSEFKERTGCSEDVGAELGVDDELVTRFMSAVRITGMYLLKAVDTCLAESSGT